MCPYCGSDQFHNVTRIGCACTYRCKICDYCYREGSLRCENDFYILTRSGGIVSINRMDRNKYDITDIAYGLSHTFRFAAQTPLTVAQHCVTGALMLEKDGMYAEALAFLLHDAEEAYFGDLATPWKGCLGVNGYFNGLRNSIHKFFKIPAYDVNIVADTDAYCLRTERNLLPESVHWPVQIQANCEPIESSDSAYNSFLLTYEHLNRICTKSIGMA